MSSSKNYKEQGGEKWVINGALEITPDGKLTIGGVEVTNAVNQADSTAETLEQLRDDFNALLLKLKTAGLMKLG